MKKNYLKIISSFLLVFLFITGCQKPITEKKDEEVSISKPNDGNDENQCQLTHMSVPGFDNRWHYNKKGLADEWRIDYGDGIPDIFTMTYDKHDKLSHAQWHNNGNLIATIDFTWTRDLLTREHWYDGGGVLFDGVNTYNRKGQMIKREFTDGWSAASEYSPNGNIPRRDFFFNGELVQRGDYTFNQPNNNPFLAIQGIPYGFPFVLFDFSKWWETSEKITVYDGGVPTVIEDMDPKKTVFHFGSHHYPVSVRHFDRITNSPILFTFEYQNCGWDDDAPTNAANSPSPENLTAGKSIGHPMLLRVGPPDFMRKQLEQMRKQHSN